MTLSQKIAEIENEMNKTQKNKATSFHIGMLKAKLAKLKRELIEGSSGKKGGSLVPSVPFSKHFHRHWRRL